MSLLVLLGVCVVEFVGMGTGCFWRLLFLIVGCCIQFVVCYL